MPPTLWFFTYASLFGGASLVCMTASLRAARIDEPDVRWGLVALLLTSSVWAGIDFLLLLSDTLFWKEALYIIGLLSGFATVWAWLYFCSAYAGQTLHRSRAVQVLALLLFSFVSLLKVTNPVHDQYFSLAVTTEPFPHVAVQPHVLYWVVNGLAYVLAAIGYVLLIPTLQRAHTGRAPVAVLMGLTAFPIVLNGIGYTSPWLLEINHDAIGVATFAVGVLFVYDQSFEDVQRLSEQD